MISENRGRTHDEATVIINEVAPEAVGIMNSCLAAAMSAAHGHSRR